MKGKIHPWLLIVLWLFVVVLLSACSAEPDEHIWLKSSGWSRAVYLGDTAFNDPVPLTIDDQGSIYAALIVSNDDRSESHFRVLALDHNAGLLWQRTLSEFSLHLPDLIRLMWTEHGLQLFWLDREQLFTVVLQPDGSPKSDPVLLSGDTAVGSYALAASSGGDLTLWYAGTRRAPGLYALSALDGSGIATMMDPDGMRVGARYDQSDTLHVSWLHYPVGYSSTVIFYATYQEGVDFHPHQGVPVHEMTVARTSSLKGPILGMDETHIYLFWSVIVRTGLESGDVQTKYVNFPFSEPPAAVHPDVIAVPSIYALHYDHLPNSRLEVGERVATQNSGFPRTTELQEITPDLVQAEELAIAFRSPTQYLWRKTRSQINVAYFQNGELTSYQPLSFTPSLSMAPTLISSQNRHLYVAWLEKQASDVYTVYFASTAPEISEALGQSTGRELAKVAAQVGFGMLVGILIAPIAAGAWMIVPIFLLLLTSPLRKLGSKKVQTGFSVFSLLLAIAVYWAGKMATLPGMMAYVPFSAWLPTIPGTVGMLLRWGVPALTLALSLWTAWYYTFRQGNPSTLYYILIYIGVDALITAAIYGVLFYGAI